MLSTFALSKLEHEIGLSLFLPTESLSRVEKQIVATEKSDKLQEKESLTQAAKTHRDLRCQELKALINEALQKKQDLLEVQVSYQSSSTVPDSYPRLPPWHVCDSYFCNSDSPVNTSL